MKGDDFDDEEEVKMKTRMAVTTCARRRVRSDPRRLIYLVVGDQVKVVRNLCQ